MDDDISLMAKPKKKELRQSLIELRRSKILEEVAQGNGPREISNKLGVPETTVRRDIGWIHTKAKQRIRTFVDDQLIPEFYRSLAVLDVLNKKAWELLNRETEKREQLMAIEVIKGLNRERLDILTHQDMLKSALNISEKNNSNAGSYTLSEQERKRLDKEAERRYQAASKRYSKIEKQESTKGNGESSDYRE